VRGRRTFSAVALVLVTSLMATACGGGGATATPTVKRSGGGAFYARVKSHSEAAKACAHDQDKLGSQLKTLGATSNVAKLVFEFDPIGLTEVPSSVTGGTLAAGDTVDAPPYEMLCGVAVH